MAGSGVSYNSVPRKGMETQFERSRRVPQMPGIRLHPGYHGCRTRRSHFTKLLRLATERELIVQIAHLAEDRRHDRPHLQVEPPRHQTTCRGRKENPGASAGIAELEYNLHWSSL